MQKFRSAEFWSKGWNKYSTFARIQSLIFWITALVSAKKPSQEYFQAFQYFFVPRLFEEIRRDIVFGFPSFRLSFRLSVPLKYMYYVPCVRNSSYSFMPIHLKLYRCFCHGLNICMWFGYYPEIIFVTFSAV